MDRRRFLRLAVLGAVLAGCATHPGRLRSAGPPRPEAAPPVDDPGPDGPRPDDPGPDPSVPDPDPTDDPGPPDDPGPSVDPALRERTPEEWGEAVTGVRTRLATDAAVVALTFDLCGGPGGSDLDTRLLGFLRREQVPATLFVNARWIDANPAAAAELADDPLFELDNHGTRHRPLSVTGRSAYGITGTASVDEVIDEVLGNQHRLTELTGRAPATFRSGTAHYDEVAVEVVSQLGLEVAGFDVLGDAGGTFSAGQVAAALTGAAAGSIALLHLNQPGSGTAAGVEQAVPALRSRGLEPVRLSAYPLA